MSRTRPTLRTTVSMLVIAATTTGLSLAAEPAPAPAAAPAGPHVIARGKDAPTVPVALWMENGKPMILRGEDSKKAPPSATIVHTTIYALDGLSYRRVAMPKGAKFSPPPNTQDTLIYMLKGKLKVKLGEVSGEIGPGDAFRERAGVPTEFNLIEDSEFLETNVPAQAAAAAPAPAAK